MLTSTDILFLFIVKCSIFINYKFLFELAPFFASDLGISLRQLTTILALPEVAVFLGAFISPFLDKIPIYNLIFWTYIEIGITTGLVALLRIWPGTPVYALLLVLRFLFGVGYAFITPAISTLILEWTPEHIRGRAMSFVWFGRTAVTFTFPILGYIVENYPDEEIWLGLGIISILLAFIFYYSIPEKARRHTSSVNEPLFSNSENVEGNLAVRYCRISKKLVQNVRFIAVMSFGFLQSLGSVLVPVLFGVWLKNEYGYNAAQVGEAVLSLSVGDVLAFMVSFFMVDRFGVLSTLYFATGCEVMVALIFGLAPGLGLKSRIILIMFEDVGTDIAFFCSITWSRHISEHTFVVLTCLFAIFAMGKAVMVVLAPIIWSLLEEHVAWSPMSLVMLLSGFLVLLATLGIAVGEYVHRKNSYIYQLIP